MRERKKYFTTTSDLMTNATKRFKLKDKLVIYKIWSRWEEIVGRAAAMHALPDNMFKGVLIVKVDHATWMQELGYLKKELLTKIEKFFPSITFKDIRFSQGPLPKLPLRIERKRPVDKHPLTDNEIEFIEHNLRPIKDDAIREAAKKAMRAGLSRKR